MWILQEIISKASIKVKKNATNFILTSIINEIKIDTKSIVEIDTFVKRCILVKLEYFGTQSEIF